jgi:two-component system phosphate regulon sensor histidine kinase PhoR/two-component system sensor histidine kinase VicK
VFQNLIANAINYNKPKGEVDISFEEKDKNVIFTCRDTGVGIPKDEQWKLFSRFYRGTNILKKETSGTGLGLFIVKAIVESSGGKIWFESEEDQGSTFYVSFPLDLDKREIKKQLNA